MTICPWSGAQVADEVLLDTVDCHPYRYVRGRHAPSIPE
jgi:hypothetical protein